MHDGFYPMNVIFLHKKARLFFIGDGLCISKNKYYSITIFLTDDVCPCTLLIRTKYTPVLSAEVFI